MTDIKARECGRCRAALLLMMVPVALAGCGGATTCTSFTYSSWGDCQSDGGQARTVLTSSPAACSAGDPVLSQSCTGGPDGAGLYQADCSSSSCHGAIASSTLKGKNPTVSRFDTFHGTGAFGLTSVQLEAIFKAVGP